MSFVREILRPSTTHSRPHHRRIRHLDAGPFVLLLELHSPILKPDFHLKFIAKLRNSQSDNRSENFLFTPDILNTVTISNATFLTFTHIENKPNNIAKEALKKYIILQLYNIVNAKGKQFQLYPDHHHQ